MSFGNDQFSNECLGGSHARCDGYTGDRWCLCDCHDETKPVTP